MTRLKHVKQKSTSSYAGFSQIDGSHPIQDQVPFSHVAYQARYRPGGKVAFFNFTLAKEMGLIDPGHVHEMNAQLEAMLLQTFSLLIVNEYDQMHPERIDKSSVKPKLYMATRYLQLQHSDRRGLSSGDGRSIWNGAWQFAGKTWDISSCGTGATCLSPASSKSKTFFRSGDPYVSYGCGYSKLHEGIIDTLFSEILHRNGVRTERVLCVIEFPKGFAVTVRAAENLLRPSHFFLHLKQGRWDRLKAMVDYHIQRQVGNSSWTVPAGQNPYDCFLQAMTRNFAEASARFEADYIFCWMEWDGDNILADAGIIDYGSIRQFGLFFHEYRFDDHERWSTNLKEQRGKARYMVQTFAQMIDFLKTGRKKKIGRFARHAAVKAFDKLFLRSRRLQMLRRMGLTEALSDELLTQQRKTVLEFEKSFMRLEYAKTKKGEYRVPDGKNWNVLYVMRRILRELPQTVEQNVTSADASNLLQQSLAWAAHDDAHAVRPAHVRELVHMTRLYRQLMVEAASLAQTDLGRLMKVVSLRTTKLNDENRITGDAVCLLAEQLMAQRRHLSSKQFHKLLELIIREQVLNPDYQPSPFQPQLRNEARLEPLVRRASKTVRSYREGL
ncbi:MAG TPA: protein adenylyltransferase SelO family protein [Oligoflexus sp.]|uniref:protein adenylyltransferase SelO family protein n=1 Tax=Oligoflexus sp. TaxID=1971216 RepID=UPI002D5CFE6B|nr:protein adenylyltransferase SelO family protein [Oligoflexus sp.]HYX37008.1 protein adenylyltransferase SelO family protein [Oligoflexus sp.]